MSFRAAHQELRPTPFLLAAAQATFKKDCEAEKWTSRTLFWIFPRAICNDLPRSVAWLLTAHL